MENVLVCLNLLIIIRLRIVVLLIDRDQLQVLLNDIYISSIRTITNRYKKDEINIYTKPDSIRPLLFIFL